jgi:hypothetical protein
MKPRRPFLDHKSAFLEAFRETGSVIRAAEIVEVRRQMYYRWLKDDPSYAARFLALNVRANSNHSYEAKKRARRIRALADIADGTSDKLLIQIAELINASRKEKGAAPEVQRRLHRRRSEDQLEVETKRRLHRRKPVEPPAAGSEFQ